MKKEEKKCSKCGEIKQLDEFCKDKNVKSGLKSICKVCWRIYDRRYKQEHRKESNEYSRNYRLEHSEWLIKSNREYYRNNTKKENERSVKYYRENNKKVKKQRNKHQKEKRLSDPHFRLKQNVSHTINKCLKRRLSSKKGKSTFNNILPYTVDELKKHLENQFEPWMNWSNWGKCKGKWNIDHIKPDSSFNYKSVEDMEFQECWALENLRPMDAIENIKKGNKIVLTPVVYF